VVEYVVGKKVSLSVSSTVSSLVMPRVISGVGASVGFFVLGAVEEIPKRAAEGRSVRELVGRVFGILGFFGVSMCSDPSFSLIIIIIITMDIIIIIKKSDFS
jgi:hypothetical protein